MGGSIDRLRTGEGEGEDVGMQLPNRQAFVQSVMVIKTCLRTENRIDWSCATVDQGDQWLQGGLALTILLDGERLLWQM